MTVTIPPHNGVVCGTIGPGVVTLTFTHAAKLVNPARPGSYRIRGTHDKRAFSAMLVIKPAA